MPRPLSHSSDRVSTPDRASKGLPVIFSARKPFPKYPDKGSFAFYVQATVDILLLEVGVVAANDDKLMLPFLMLSDRFFAIWGADDDLMKDIKRDKATHNLLYSGIGASCGSCGKDSGSDEGLKRCSRCRVALYCSPGCQRNHWPQHKKLCFG